MIDSYWAFSNHKRKPLTDLICILDIDETLVHTFDRFDSWEKLKIMTDPKKMDLRSRCYVINPAANKSNGSVEPMWGVKRPHLEKFLEFCFTYFKYVIPWSAGIYNYVHEIVDNIFISTLAPHAVLTREDCTGPIGNLEKPLAKLIEIIPSLKDHIVIDKINARDNIKNVIIIDDRKKSFNQNLNNGILIPVYEPDPTAESIRQNDIALLQIINWLSRLDVMKTTDVRKLDKSHIFSSNINNNDSNIETVNIKQKIDLPPINKNPILDNNVGNMSTKRNTIKVNS